LTINIYSIVIKQLSFVYVADNIKEIILDIDIDFNSCNPATFKRVLGISSEEFISSTQNLSTLSAFIVPKSMLFEKMDLC